MYHSYNQMNQMFHICKCIKMVARLPGSFLVGKVKEMGKRARSGPYIFCGVAVLSE